MAATTTTKPLTGRRKEAVARVRLTPGTGKAMINGRAIHDYLTRDSLVLIALRPLTLTNTAGSFDVTARVMGGGLTGQAGAVSLGIARALARQDEAHKALLGRAGLLTRDSRMKERKKYGQPGARKRFQFSKR